MFEISRTQISQRTVSSKRNLYFDTTRTVPVMRKFGEEEMTLADFRAAGLEYGSLVADPLFENPEEHDFRLKEGSPALALGFRPIDVTDVGPRAVD